MTPEGKVKTQVKRVLNHPLIWHYMPVTNGMGAATLDFMCVVRIGNMPIFFAVETKAPGKKPTPRQNALMDDLKLRMNARCFVVDGDKSLGVFEQWLHKLLSLAR